MSRMLYIATIVDVDRDVIVEAFTRREDGMAWLVNYVTTYHGDVPRPAWIESDDDLLQWHNESTVDGEMVNLQPVRDPRLIGA